MTLRQLDFVPNDTAWNVPENNRGQGAHQVSQNEEKRGEMPSSTLCFGFMIYFPSGGVHCEVLWVLPGPTMEGPPPCPRRATDGHVSSRLTGF